MGPSDFCIEKVQLLALRRRKEGPWKGTTTYVQRHDMRISRLQTRFSLLEEQSNIGINHPAQARS